MNKTIIKSDALNEQYYSFTHESGLEILLYPMEGFSSSYALFGTKYGSIDSTFKTQHDTEFTTVPEGIAHFLEHKLFESEGGPEFDAFNLFAKTGASANAFTSFDKTCYLFSTTENFEESLKILLEFVQSPYFTDKTVEKEQGIIGQEIKMYEDMADNHVFYKMLEMMYEVNPVRINIAGTVESISKIDADLLYKCYNTFYNLNNMVIAITGNFDVDTALKIIESNLKTKEKIVITRGEVNEKPEVVSHRYEEKFQVSLPQFCFGYKEKPVAEKDLVKTNILYNIILDSVVGKSSELYKKLYDEGHINSDFGKDVFCGPNYMTNIFSGESRTSDVVMKRINDALQETKKTGISEEAFTRLKKAAYGHSIVNYNDVEEVAVNLLSSHFLGINGFGILDAISSATLEEVNSLLRSSFNEDYISISVLNPL